jgi:mono/diheme cytochrome c family protein
MAGVGLCGVLLAACAGQPADTPGLGRNDDVSRGEAIAQLRCAPCHAVGASDRSPRSAAPPFRRLRMRFNEIAWERALRQIAEGGHDEMPPVAIDPSEASDLHAYVGSLR